MRLLHNMSQPPRTTVVVAPHRTAARGLRLDTSAWLPAEGVDWLPRLCAALGIEPGDDPQAALTAHTAAALQRAALPGVLVLGAGQGAGRCADPLLVVAVLSRASDHLFLARRAARFDRERLARPLVLFRAPDRGGAR